MQAFDRERLQPPLQLLLAGQLYLHRACFVRSLAVIENISSSARTAQRPNASCGPSCLHPRRSTSLLSLRNCNRRNYGMGTLPLVHLDVPDMNTLSGDFSCMAWDEVHGLLACTT